MKKNTKKRKIISFGKFFVIICSCLVVGLMFTLADLFSSLITVGGFSFTNGDIYFSKFTVYALSTASTDSKIQAEEQANMCMNQGGAGYIYLGENKFYVIASIYENKVDAEKVYENLKESLPHSNILSLTVPEISLSNSLESQEKNTLEEAISIFKTTYKKLYDTAISLDTSVINEVNARLSINQIGSNISAIQSNFLTIFNEKMTNDLLAIKIKLEDLAINVDNLISSSGNVPLSSLIKRTYCKTIFLYKELSELVNN